MKKDRLKVLAINNYSLEICEEKADKLKMPRQHCWGVDFLRKNGCEVETSWFTGNEVSNRMRAVWNQFRFNFCMLFYARKNNLVISFCGKSLGFFALFKKMHLIPKETIIVSLIHHYSPVEILSSGYDRILFLSPVIMEKYAIKYPALKERMRLIHWGPDLDFYDYWKEKLREHTNEVSLFSNGKSRRDNELVIDVCRRHKIPFYYITSHGVASSENNEEYEEISENRLETPEMLKVMLETSVSVIPIRHYEGVSEPICGLTSVLDAVACGQPFIISDNTNLGIDFEEKNIGIVYKTGSGQNFEKKLICFLNDKDRIKKYGINGRAYAEKYDYKNYCNELMAIINEVLDESN